MIPLSLFELNEYIRQVISLNFTEPLWIRAELNQISFSRGHAYLELIQKDEAKNEIIAQAQAAIWYRNLKFIEQKTGPQLHTILKKGLQILLKVKVEFNERYGLKFSVEDIDTSYVLGQLELKRREILETLKSQGLLEKNKAVTMAPVLQRLAIISSEKAAGLQDFIHHLQENAYDFAFQCELFSAAMQGKNVERDILKACRNILNEKIQYDAVILIRGGGSKLDLSAFDELNLCVALANLPFPVITGIGHEIDQSIADLVAHTALKTPTAVANFIIDYNLAFESSLFTLLRSIEDSAKQILLRETNILQQLGSRIHRLASQRIHFQSFQLNQLVQNLGPWAHQIIKQQTKDLANQSALLLLSDPTHIMRRGYSITTIHGKLLRSVHEAIPGHHLETKLIDGTVRSITE
jgi:exodeoxyribonuclease VII large subunit